jgi:hypothetical protein
MIVLIAGDTKGKIKGRGTRHGSTACLHMGSRSTRRMFTRAALLLQAAPMLAFRRAAREWSISPAN